MHPYSAYIYISERNYLCVLSAIFINPLCVYVCVCFGEHVFLFFFVNSLSFGFGFSFLCFPFERFSREREFGLQMTLDGGNIDSYLFLPIIGEV